MAEPDLLIVSGSSRIRTAASLNHRIYADRIGVRYVFDNTPSTVDRIFLQKIDVLRRVLPFADWVFWVDDDAFFTDFGVDLRRFLDDVQDRELVFCQSPVNPRGGWTWMSSGQFFLRRSPATAELLDAVAATDLDVVRAWWDPEQHGLFTNGDQDAFVHQLLEARAEHWRDRYLRLPWEAFNSRPYHYSQSLDEHFLCHFAVPGGRPKADLVAEFAARMGTTPALCDAAAVAQYKVFVERSELGALLAAEWPPRATDGASVAPVARGTSKASTSGEVGRRLPGTDQTLAKRARRRVRRVVRRLLGRQRS